MRLSVAMNPTGCVIWRRDMVLPDPGDPLQFVKELLEWSLIARLRPGMLREPPGQLVLSLPKETRMQGGVWPGGEKPQATRLGVLIAYKGRHCPITQQGESSIS
jgi:hypothetical protein